MIGLPKAKGEQDDKAQKKDGEEAEEEFEKRIVEILFHCRLIVASCLLRLSIVIPSLFFIAMYVEKIFGKISFRHEFSRRVLLKIRPFLGKTKPPP